jgi:phosphoribosylanthranilate isomerase|tara:strand:- start:11015 stop:11635 length:621 start_codon:yes stop_codon:yes gene_type:complete
MSVQVKICGITTPEQALMVQQAGADALGLVIYRNSSRYIDLRQAVAVRAAIASDVLCVVLLVNADKEFVKQVIAEVKPDLLQFHGDESAEFCQQFGFPYIRALRMHDDLNIAAQAKAHKAAHSLLFDAWHPGQYGGTGERFDWARLPRERNFNLILAGGLNPDNVAEAVAAVAPDMVDVSGGVESAPGIKDPTKVRDFIQRAKAAG